MNDPKPDYVTYYYEGSISPDVIPLTLEYEPEVVRKDCSFAPDAEFKVSVFVGRVRVKVVTARYDDEVADALFFAAWSIAESYVATAGFIRAIPYSVSMERLVAPDGRIRQLALGDRSLAARHDFDDGDLERLADAVVPSLPASLAISDLLMTLGKLDYSPIACGRVADSIARLLAPDENRSKQWYALRTALRVDEAFVRSLSDVSKASRHGDRVEIPAEINNQTAHRAWALLGRYLRYVLDGPLDPVRYPIIEG
jgi:hypothetical protein